jgi:ABC-type glycerol-3-phosphate transport system permease component
MDRAVLVLAALVVFCFLWLAPVLWAVLSGRSSRGIASTGLGGR